MNEKITYRPISEIYIIKKHLLECLSASKEQQVVFRKAKERPSSMDDELVSEMYKTIAMQDKDIKLLDQQLEKWHKEANTQNDKEEVQKMESISAEITSIHEELMEICDYIKDKTINSILNMDEAELALKTLSGEIPFPTRK